MVRDADLKLGWSWIMSASGMRIWRWLAEMGSDRGVVLGTRDETVSITSR